MRFKLSYDKPAFADYEPSLRALESSFKKAGVPVTFEAVVLPESGSRVVFIRNNDRITKSIMIEGDSPAQAVKDVAEAVRL
jgi:hypothetical protein